VGCRCESEECGADKVDLGVFGNPRTVCKLGTPIEGPVLNGSYEFKAVTWNLQGWLMQPSKIREQAAVLLSFDADFIATQEDRYGWDTQKAMGEGLYCFVGETRDGRSCNPSCPSRVPLSSNGGDGEHTFIYYNCKRWQVLETNTYYMGWFPDNYPRVYTNGLFQNLATRQKIWVTSTHFPKKKEVDGQKNCIEYIKGMGDESRGLSLLMADFNIVESAGSSSMYRPLKQNRFIFDTYDVCPRCRTCHDGYDKHFATFTGSNAWCDNTHAELSDHDPIIVTYQI